MDTPHRNKEQNDKKSSEPFDAEEKQQEEKENSKLKKNALASDKPNPGNSESGQSSLTRESHEQPDRQNSELPQTTSPYHGQQQDQSRQPIQPYSRLPSSQNSNQPAQTNPQNLSQPRKSYQQHLTQPGQPQQQYSFQPGPPYPPNSPQSGQFYQQYYSQPAQPYPPYPPQPRQYAPPVGKTYQHYPSQPGQYTSPPMQYQPVYYGPNQQNPQRTFVIHVSSQPPSAQDTPMARPGRRPNETEPAIEGWGGFQDSKVRTAFVRKVYIILTTQLLFTMGIIALFVFEPHVKEFIRKNLYLYYVSMAVFVAVFIGLACFQNLRRSFPSNLIALIVFTLSMSCMLGIISSLSGALQLPMMCLCTVIVIFCIFHSGICMMQISCCLVASFLVLHFGWLAVYLYPNFGRPMIAFANYSLHKTEAVLMAVGICAAVCFVVTVFSFCTKIDFTSCGALLCILVLILIMFGLIAIFMPSKIMTMIYAATGATVFTLFLAYDTQMLMGGKTVEISPEEYIFAAVQIYLDVAFIFLFILTIITYCNE